MYCHVNFRMEVVHVAPKKEVVSPHWASMVRPCAVPDEALQEAIGICAIGEGSRGWILWTLPGNKVLYLMHLVADPKVHTRKESIGRVVEALP
jgi:hypothetical protein